MLYYVAQYVLYCEDKFQLIAGPAAGTCHHVVGLSSVEAPVVVEELDLVGATSEQLSKVVFLGPSSQVPLHPVQHLQGREGGARED